MRKLERLPDAELEVMQALWQLEPYPVTSAQLMEKLSGRHWRLPTLLKLLSRLEERGFVANEKEGRNNRYRPLVDEREYLAAESGRLCAVCFNSRFHLACQKARQLIEEGSFGRPLLIHGNYLQEFHALPSPKDWRYNEAVAGRMRAVTEIGSHWLDLAQYISGLRAQAVSATFGRFWPRRSLQDGIMYPEGQPGQPMEVVSEDAAAVTLRFEGGALGSMLLSEASPGRGNHLALEITCENGSIWWNAEDNNRLYTARKGEGVRCEVFAFGNGFDDTFAMLFRSFYDAVEGKAPAGPWATFDQGAYITAACQAMAASADADSRWVEIKGADKL